MRTSNPALGENTFKEFSHAVGQEAMTISGTVNKTAILLFLVIAAAIWPWTIYFNKGNPAGITPYILIGALGGLIFAMITIFKKEWAPVTAPVYAILEGLLLGAISAVFESKFQGIVLQAVGLTFGTLFCLLLAYSSGLIKATENFKLGVIAATGGIFVIYLVTMILGFFKIQVPYIHDSGPWGIAFSLFVVIIAALNLVLDFDFIEKGAAMRAPKYMEWYGAFGLMVTLIWLYLEILRLLAKTRSSR